MPASVTPGNGSAHRERDAAARHTIRTALETNVMVLAGAGAGKTHEMIERMTALVRSGAPVERIAAITFTRKAAGEMQARFFQRLQALYADAAADPDEASRLRDALERVDQCTIGTIHAFCGRLLRERPTEAGLPPDFSELDERDERRLRRTAWRAYLASTSPEARERLAIHGISTRDLFDFFGDLCLYSDLPLHRPEASPPDLQPAVERVQAFIDAWLPHVPSRPVDEKGYDDVQRALVRGRLLLDHHGLHTPGDRAHLIEQFARLDGKITLKRWGERGSEAYAAAQHLKKELLPELAAALGPALRAWEAWCYGLCADFCLPAVAHYRKLRIDAGRLTFQDLLECTRDLLRDHPDVRRHFQDRYRYLFVDEFQDTDPIQAEILFYLTDTERLDETDWSRLAPAPGRLFLVGDGKQSIYRFRRADYETFAHVRDRLGESGRVVRLQQSFRSFENLCAWCNGAFPGLFARFEAPHQAPFQELLFWERRRDPHEHARLRLLTTGYKPGNIPTDIVADEADRIARFVAAIVRDRGPLYRRYVDELGLLPPDVDYGAFMILTRKKARLGAYAAALERYGVPCEIAGGGGLGRAAELHVLLEFLETVRNPDDPVPLLATLRGPLAGCSDADLYTFHRTGGRLTFHADVPDGLPAELAERFDTAFGHLRRAESLLTTMPPSAALAVLLEELGYLVSSAFGAGGSGRAGNLLKVLALARDMEARTATWTDVLDELRALVLEEAFEMEEMTLETGAVDEHERPRAVRVMNLHKAKGLEADVVFLADPYERGSGHAPTVHVSRVGRDAPFVALPVSSASPFGKGRAVRYRPEGWEGFEAEEQTFLDAENDRLLYVAATRARRLLVLSRYRDRKDQVLDGPWSPLYAACPDTPELETPAVDPPSASVPAVDADAVRARRAVVRDGLARPGYARRTASEGSAVARAVRTLIGAFVDGRVAERSAGGFLNRLLFDQGLTPAEHHAPARRLFISFLRSPLRQRLDAARAVGAPVYAAVPFTAPATGNGSAIYTDVIDLAYRTSNGWELVFLATDEEPEAAAAERAVAGARHWEAATGEAPSGRSVWELGTGRERAV